MLKMIIDDVTVNDRRFFNQAIVGSCSCFYIGPERLNVSSQA